MNAEIILKALDYIGQEEKAGYEDNNPVIVGMIRRVWSWAKEDEIPWCSAFMNAIAEELSLEKTNTLAARDWLDVGEEIEEPEKGDVAIFWRESISSWKGHVGIFVRKDSENIWVLGGNQGNKVSISPYPIYRLLGFRRLRGLEELL